MKKKLIVATICGAIAGAVIPYNAYALTQDETVYAKLDAAGSLSYVSVTGHLINDLKDSQIVMKAGLKEVENLNGFEEHTIEGDSLIWKADGKDIYYSGKTDQKLPIEVAVSYKLDDEEKELEEILGKSGKVEVRLKYKNLSKVGDLYTPFVVAMGTILDETNVRNVEVTNGKVINNGKNVIVSAIAAPGLYESLDYEDLKKMGEVILTYETEKFELSDIYNFVTPKVLDDNDLKIFDKMDDLYANADKLSNGSKELVDGTSKLRDGVKKLRDSVASAKSKLANMGNLMSDTMLDSIAETAATAARKKVAAQKDYIRGEVHKQVAGMTSGLDINGITASIEANSKAVGKKYVTQMMQSYIKENNLEKAYGLIVNGSVATVCADESNPDCIDVKKILAKQDEFTRIANEMISETLAPVQSALGGVGSGFNSSAIEEKLFNTIYNNMQNVAVQTASETARTVAAQVADSIQTGISEKLNTLMDEVIKGIDQILVGADDLNDGMRKFDQEGIQTLSNFVNGDIKNTSRKLERLTKLADEYNNFGAKAENAKMSTKFVLMIEGKKS